MAAASAAWSKSVSATTATVTPEQTSKPRCWDAAAAFFKTQQNLFIMVTKKKAARFGRPIRVAVS